MEDNKKIKKLIENKAKLEDIVRGIHKIIFKEAGLDNTEMKILRNEYDKVKRQLDKVNEEIAQLRQEYEAETKPTQSKNFIPEQVAEEPDTQRRNAEISKTEIVESYANRNIDKAKEKSTKLERPILELMKKKESDKKAEVVEANEKQEDEKLKQDVESQKELDNKEEKPKTMREKVKFKGIVIKGLPKTLIDNERDEQRDGLE